MKRLSLFVGISFICHLVLILTVVDIDFSQKDITTYDVYEVSIVSSVPAVKQPRSSVKISGGKKYVYKKGSDQSALSGIKKESALKDHTPELSPADIKPVKREDEEPLPDIDSDSKDNLSTEMKKYESATTGDLDRNSLARLSTNPVNIWKTQVRSLVNSRWRTPPEISSMDMSLKTTYLLRISRGGELLDKRLLVSSGNSPFDRSVLLALSNIQKLPNPPLVMIAGRNDVEITMSFTPPEGAE
jgi:TonB family protein